MSGPEWDEFSDFYDRVDGGSMDFDDFEQLYHDANGYEEDVE
jgi:hypothetical protein